MPFSLSLLEVADPGSCYVLGLAYVICLTASMFNLLAMVMAEAYTFHEQHDHIKDKHGTVMCVGFGILTIYIGTVILHLGPTLIGGEFKYNKDIGNCLFAYGKRQVSRSELEVSMIIQ